MQLLLAQPARDAILDRIKSETKAFSKATGRKPKLEVVLVGEDPASVIYTTKKTDMARSIGFESETLKFPINTPATKVQETLRKLNQDSTVDGILLQRPLPKDFAEEKVSYWISPEKDVDAFHPENVGRLVLGLETFQPCTPSGVMELLRHYKIAVSGKSACVVGRSSIVGKPMAQLLLASDATVLQAHSKTSNLSEITNQADILVVAAGKPKLIQPGHIRKGAVVIDVGIHRASDGTLCGDVDFDAVKNHVSAITPVPGGVGPMTIAILLRNTLRAAQRREKR